MADHARSASAEVQVQLDRLWALSPGADMLGLGRITALLARVGNPQRCLPPVFHVAGTNGKGSTCAFLRAMLEAAGHRVHVYSSPHLVRFNERIRLAGTLIEDDALAALLREVLDAGGDLGASFFEVTTAAAFLAFARSPADACVIEVGLGGRLDATNVFAAPAACAIASLGIDHEGFLLVPEDGTPTVPIARIAFEKAGIAKAGVPLVTQAYPREPADAVAAVAVKAGATWLARGKAWHAAERNGALDYRDERGSMRLPLPKLAGPHQRDNAALAVAVLRHQKALAVPDAALATGITNATWPARLQRLGAGPLIAGRAAPVWLDGGHNGDAGHSLAGFFAAQDASLSLVIGMLANKDPTTILAPLADALAERLVAIVAVPVPDHESHTPGRFGVIAGTYGCRFATAGDVTEALALLEGAVLIAGSLYLAGDVLRRNDETPD